MRIFLNRFEIYLKKKYRRLFKQHRFITMAFFIFLLGIGVHAKDLKFLLFIDDLIDDDFKTYHQLRELNQNYPDATNVFVSIDLGDQKKNSLCSIKEWVQNIIDQRRDIKSIFTSYGIQQIRIDQGKIKHQYLLDPDCSRLNHKEEKTIENNLIRLKNSPFGGLVTDKNANQIILFFDLFKQESESRFGDFDPSPIGDLIQDLQYFLKQKELDLSHYWGGIGVYMYFLKNAFIHTIKLNALSGFLILLIFFVFFRSFKLGFTYLFLYHLILFPTYGMMALFNIPIDSLSNSLALLILIASIEDFLFLNRNRCIEKFNVCSFRKFLIPGFFTSLTTLIGFGSLYFSDMFLIGRFGFVAAFSAMLEFIVMYFIYPYLIKLFPKFFFIQKYKNFEFKSIKKWNCPSWLIWMSAFFLIFSIFNIKNLNISDEPEKIFSEKHQLNQYSQKLLNSKGWKTSFSVLFEDDKMVSLNKRIIKKIQNLEHIIYIENPYEMEEFVLDNIAIEYKGALSLEYKKHFHSKRLVLPDENKARIIVYTDSSEINLITNLKNQIEKICKNDCYPAGTIISYSELGLGVFKTFVKSMLISLLLVAAIIFFLGLWKGHQNKLALVFSALWGPLMLLSLIIIFKIQVTFVSSIVISVLVGLAGDNSIHFLFHQKDQKKAVNQLSQSSFKAMFAMIILSSVFFFSYFKALQILGFLLILGLILSIFGDIFIYRRLISRPK